MQEQGSKQDISEDTVARYLESKDFTTLPPSKKDEVVAYLKTRMRRAVSPAPDVGGQTLKKFQSADPQAKAMQGYAERVEDEDSPKGSTGEQLLVGAGRSVKSLFDTAKDIGTSIAHPSQAPKIVAGPHIETFKKSKEAFKSGKTSEGLGYAGATALPFVGPWAAHLGDITKKGGWAEALGEAGTFFLFDRLARGTQRETPRSMRLSAASGALPEHFEVLAKDMAETAKKSGTPKTVGELAENLKETNNRITSEFNQLLQPLRGRQRVPQEVSTKLLQKAQEFDTHTPEGRATRNYLRRRAVDYMKPWTLGELDAKRRQMFNARLEGKSQAGQTAAMKASDELLADKVIEDGLKDIVYGDVEVANPRVNIRGIKEKESRLIEVRDQLKKQIDQLTQGQSEFQSSPLTKKLGMSMSGHVGGITPRLHGLLPKSGPLDIANKQVKRGFPSKANKLRDLGMKLRVQTIKNYPIAALYSQSQKSDKSTGDQE